MIRHLLIIFLCLEMICYPVCFAQEAVEENKENIQEEVKVESQEVQAGQAVGETEAGKVVTLEGAEKELAEGIEEEKTEEELKPGYVTVNFKGADIRAVLNYLSDVGGVDIVPAPDVTGPVTLKLTNKPWETALDIVVRNYGFSYEREADIIRVVTVESLKQEELSTEVVKLNYAKAGEITDSIKDMLSERGKIKSDSRTNVLVITDIPTYIYKIKQIITKLDRKTPQIMIEAKIIETVLNKSEKMGIDWNIRIAASGAKRPITLPFEAWGNFRWLGHELTRFFPIGQTNTASVTTGSGVATTTGVAEFPGTPEGTHAFPFVEADQFTYGTLDFSQFSAVLEYLKQRADTEIVSNPRVTTLNNKEAKILVGRVYNFPTFDQVELTGKWIISGYQSKELGIKLLVTPNVNENDEIVVDLKPEISNYLGQEKISEELSAPLWSTREAETQIRVKDGDTIFIGGLIRENIIEKDNRFPILGDLLGEVPFIGPAVKYTSKQKEKTELIFFISVNIVKDSSQLAEVANVSSEVYVPLSGETIEPEKGEEARPKDSGVSKEEKKYRPWFDFRKKKTS